MRTTSPCPRTRWKSASGSRPNSTACPSSRCPPGTSGTARRVNSRSSRARRTAADRSATPAWRRCCGCACRPCAARRQLGGDRGPGQVGRKIPQYPEFARAQLFRQRRRGLVFGRRGCAVHEVEDVGEQRGVRCLMLRQRLQQFRRARHHERQEQPVLLGESECMLGGPVRRTLVASWRYASPASR